MTYRSGNQWPEPYRQKHLAPDFDKSVRSLTAYRVIFPLSMQFKFGMCLALIGPPTIALLLFALLPAVYRAQTNVIVGTSLDHEAKTGGDTIETDLQVPIREFVNAEADLLSNPVVVEQTLAHLGIAELYPDIQTSQTSSQMAWDAAIQQFQSSLRVVPIQQLGIIRLTFEHTNANIAVKALNQFVLSYQLSRTKVLEGRNSRTDSATILRNVKDLEQLERTREEIRTTIGTADIAQQREKLIRQRTDADTHLRQTMERIQALSIRLADLTQIRSRVVADNPLGQIDNRAGAAPVRHVTGEQKVVPAATVPSKNQIVVVQDQPVGAGTATSQLSSSQSPLQLAPRLLNQFMTRSQGLPVKVTAGSGLAAYEARIARDLRDLDNLEQKDPERKPPNVTAAGQPRRTQPADRNEQSPQPKSDTESSREKTIVLTPSPKNSTAVVLSTLAGAAPISVASAKLRADFPLRQFIMPSGDDQSDPLIQRLQQRLPAIQEQVGNKGVIPVKLPIAPRAVATAIDGDRVSAQTELDALKARQTRDTVSIGLIDEKLLRLGRSELRLNLLNARIADQHERVTIAQRLHDNAKAAEDRDQAGIGDTFQTSSEAISVSSMTPGKLALAFGSAIASLFLVAIMLVIAMMSGRKLIARDETLELFLNAPKSETL